MARVSFERSLTEVHLLEMLWMIKKSFSSHQSIKIRAFEFIPGHVFKNFADLNLIRSRKQKMSIFLFSSFTKQFHFVGTESNFWRKFCVEIFVNRKNNNFFRRTETVGIEISASNALELLLCFDFSINLIFREIVGLKPGLTRATRVIRLQHLQGPGNATTMVDREESLLVLKWTTQELAMWLHLCPYYPSPRGCV